MTIIIQADKLSKKYLINHTHRERNDLLRDELASFFRTFGKRSKADDYEEFWALNDLSFEIRKGDRVGVIGRNGAGKSTLLKILSRITEPTSGKVSIRGRVASLLEVGTGFHPDLSGRENIYLNGTILGMKRDEIKRKFDEIIAFAEVEKFLDTPVKRYSSGMYVRLAFAIAAHLEPETLIVDEILAVGDAAFQKKCLAKMNKIGEEGTTVIFVSHNIAAIQNLCGTALLLAKGCLMAYGEINSVIHQYLKQSQELAYLPLAGRTDRKGNGSIRFTSLELQDARGHKVSAFHSGEHVKLLFRFVPVLSHDLRDVVVTVVVENELGTRMAYLSNAMAEHAFPLVPKSISGFEMEIDKIPFLPGFYSLNLHCSINGEIADWIQNAGYLTIEAGDFYGTGRLAPVANQECVLIQHRFHLHHSVLKPTDQDSSGLPNV